MDHATRSVTVDAFPLTPKRIDLCNPCSGAFATMVNEWMDGGFWQ